MPQRACLDRVIEGGGGNNNGDTRYDYTEYIETAPHLRARSRPVDRSRSDEDAGFLARRIWRTSATSSKKKCASTC